MKIVTIAGLMLALIADEKNESMLKLF